MYKHRKEGVYIITVWLIQRNSLIIFGLYIRNVKYFSFSLVIWLAVSLVSKLALLELPSLLWVQVYQTHSPVVLQPNKMNMLMQLLEMLQVCFNNYLLRDVTRLIHHIFLFRGCFTPIFSVWCFLNHLFQICCS